jgi:hypothetical protein
VDRLDLPRPPFPATEEDAPRRPRLVQRRGKEVWYSVGDRRSLTILNCMRAKKGARS